MGFRKGIQNTRMLVLVIFLPLLFSSCTATGQTENYPKPTQTAVPIPTSTSTPAPGPNAFSGVILYRPADSDAMLQFTADGAGHILYSDFPLPVDDLPGGGCMTFSADNTHLLVKKGGLQIVDLKKQTVTPLGSEEIASSVSNCGWWSPDGNKVAYFSVNGDLYVFDLLTQQNILIYEMPKANYGVSAEFAQTTIHGQYYEENPWTNSNQLLFNAYAGNMPGTVTLGAPNPQLLPNTSFLATLTDDGVALEDTAKEWGVVDSCKDGKYVLLYHYSDTDDGYFYSKGFGSFSELTPVKINTNDLGGGLGFFPGECRLWYVANDPEAERKNEPVFFHFLDLETNQDVKGPQWGRPQELRQRFAASQFFEWLGTPSENIVAVGDSWGYIYLINLATGGKTCLVTHINNDEECILKRDGFMDDMFVLP